MINKLVTDVQHGRVQQSLAYLPTPAGHWTLEALIRRPLDCALCDTKIACAEALIKLANTLSHNLPYCQDVTAEKDPGGEAWQWA